MKTIQLNPRFGHTLDVYTDGDVTVTKEPIEVSNTVAEKLLGLRRNGLPLVVEVETESEEPEEDVEPLPEPETAPDEPVGFSAAEEDEDQGE